MALAGAAAILGGTVYDVLTTGSAVDRYNVKHAHQLTVNPMIAPQTAGLSINGRF
jgi:hypothetical protein